MLATTNRARTLVAGIFIGAAVSAVALLGFERSVSTQEIDSDLGRVQALLDDAAKEESRYSGGIILAQIKFRKSIYQSSIAMLNQKKMSLIHRINLEFPQAGKPFSVDPGKTEALSAEIERINGEVRFAQSEADRYSGGLILSMILVRKAQYETSLASLEHARIAAKYAIPLVVPEDLAGPPPSRAAPKEANPDKDKEAL